MLTRNSTLIVVSCTKTKLWDLDPAAPSFVPALEAYRGCSFVQFRAWLHSPQSIELGEFRWLVLSAKYGYIEPHQPVDNYDVTFSDPMTGPISIESLRGQVLFQTRWRDLRRICAFDTVLFQGTDVYRERIEQSFAGTGASVSKLDTIPGQTDVMSSR